MSELFIQRPITTTLIMAGIVLFGFIGYRSLPVSDLPNVDYPTIQVSAGLPGASPETMASSRSEEHTSELQSHVNLVCRLLLEKKKKNINHIILTLKNKNIK